MVVSFIGGGNRSTQRKPLTLSQVTDNLYHTMLYRVYLTGAGFKFKTLVVVGTDCIGSWISNYHAIMIMKAPPVHA